MPNRKVVVENVFGTMGTVCWTIQLIPQVWKSYRSKNTDGFSPWFMQVDILNNRFPIVLRRELNHRLTWGLSSVFLGAYAILQWLNIPLIVQAQLFGFLCFLCWGQCQYYGLKRSRTVSITITVLLMATGGLLEYILIIAIKARNGSNTHGPTSVIGIIASVLLSVALLPQYWEIYKFKEVIGVSMTFLLIDILGGVFNNLSLVFKEKFDVVASMSYTLVIVLDSIIVILALILNPLARRRRAASEVAEGENQLVVR